MEIRCFMVNIAVFVNLQSYRLSRFFRFPDLVKGNHRLNRRFCEILHYVAKSAKLGVFEKTSIFFKNWGDNSKTGKNRENGGSGCKIRFTGTFPLAGRGFFGHFSRFFAIFPIFSDFSSLSR